MLIKSFYTWMHRAIVNHQRRRLVRIFDEIHALQQTRPIRVSAIILGPDEIESVASLLTPDDPPIGAIGRYKAIPIWRREDESLYSRFVEDRDHIEGVAFGFFKLDLRL